jgi:hypothetical protein
LTLETQVLSLEMSSLGVFSNLFHGVCSPLSLWQGIVNRLSICWGNSILLSKVSLLYDRIGKLLSALEIMRRKEEKTYGKKLGGIIVEMTPLFFGHDPSVQFPNLIVLANLSLM